MMKPVLFVPILFFLFNVTGRTQSLGSLIDTIPDNFYKFSKESIKIKLEQGVLSDEEFNELVNEIYYFKKEAFENGLVYINSKLDEYVKGILNNLLPALPNNSKPFEIYVLKSLETNAFCLSDGTIFVNIGLISRMENESQLAFVISHEIAHYISRHSFKEKENLNRIAEGETNSKQKTHRQEFRRLQYSREFEFDADAMALDIISRTKYAQKEGINALGLLKPAKSTFDSDSNLLVFDAFFKDSYCKIDSAWIDQISLVKSLDKVDSSKFEIFNRNYGDIFNTHPELEKRQTALQEILNSYDALNVKMNEELNSELFDETKAYAQSEIIEFCLDEGYYFLAFYFSAKALTANPKDTKAAFAMVKSVYWISYLRGINEGNTNIEEPLALRDLAFQRIKSVFENMPINELKKYSFNISKEISSQNENSDTLSFYLALNAESYLGKNASRIFYNEYLKSHPNGYYSSFITNKLYE